MTNPNNQALPEAMRRLQEGEDTQCAVALTWRQAAAAVYEIDEQRSRLIDAEQNTQRAKARADELEAQNARLLEDATHGPCTAQIEAAEAERDLNHRHMRAEAKDHGETKRLLKTAEARVAELETALTHRERMENLNAREVQRLRDRITALADELLACDPKGEFYEAGLQIRALTSTTPPKENNVNTKPNTAAALARMEEWGDEWEFGEFNYSVADFRGLLNEVRGLLDSDLSAEADRG